MFPSANSNYLAIPHLTKGISDHHLEIVKGAKTAKEMVTSLRNVFARTSPISKHFVMQRLVKLKFNGGDIQDHFVQVESLLQEFEAAEASLDEPDRACYLLLTMKESYNTVITALATMTTDLTYEFVKGRLLDTDL
ncbi:hypothetical protein PR048_005405 [Dryococelus australis]|uniref:Uncharacterized protein n=1 Tax=Dryococelus australis TaxID=614101 RepID=A0ABQ9I954_9NEOP|nr:hypothetical protein PR048_005405 [Dryococelus australis]